MVLHDVMGAKHAAWFSILPVAQAPPWRLLPAHMHVTAEAQGCHLQPCNNLLSIVPDGCARPEQSSESNLRLSQTLTSDLTRGEEMLFMRVDGNTRCNASEQAKRSEKDACESREQRAESLSAE
jgi:hypothetical protein